MDGFRRASVFVAALFLFGSTAAMQAQMAVKHSVGAERGFVVIKSLSGNRIGYGEYYDYATGDTVTVHLMYRFVDGSSDEQTTVFTQGGGSFHFVSEHRVQQGKFFPHPVDVTTNANGDVLTKTTGKDGQVKTETQHVDSPEVSYAMINTILSNTAPDAPEFKLSMVVPGAKPREVKLDVTPAGRQSFSIAGVRQNASVFRMHVDIGGVAGVIAPLVGKQPADTMISVLEGEAPLLVRIVGPLGEDTAVVDIQLAGTTFPRTAMTRPAKK